MPDRTDCIVIHINDLLKFQIVVPKRDMISGLYQTNVDLFSQVLKENQELRIARMTIRSPDLTAPASQAQIPVTVSSDRKVPDHRSILLKRKELGRGAFAVVRHVWDAITGLDYAAKEFFDSTKSDWKREGISMAKLSHVSPHPIGGVRES